MRARPSADEGDPRDGRRSTGSPAKKSQRRDAAEITAKARSSQRRSCGTAASRLQDRRTKKKARCILTEAPRPTATPTATTHARTVSSTFAGRTAQRSRPHSRGASGVTINVSTAEIRRDVQHDAAPPGCFSGGGGPPRACAKKNARVDTPPNIIGTPAGSTQAGHTEFGVCRRIWCRIGITNETWRMIVISACESFVPQPVIGFVKVAGPGAATSRARQGDHHKAVLGTSALRSDHLCLIACADRTARTSRNSRPAHQRARGAREAQRRFLIVDRERERRPNGNSTTLQTR